MLPENPEAPSGKNEKTENFPVGSFLLPAKLRPHVAVYYAFARAGDDIADDPTLSSEQKLQRLDGFERVLMGQAPHASGYEKASRVRQMLLEQQIPLRHAHDLLQAFKQDVMKNRYHSWEELLDYCEKSANPVGRFLLDLHGENDVAYAASDALSTALQVLNHLQDCGEDLCKINRCYLPLDWLEQEGAKIAMLQQDGLSPSLRRVVNRMLKHTADLIDDAEKLPRQLRSQHLAAESGVIVRLARRLHMRLQNQDPLAGRVRLSKLDFLLAGLGGVISSFGIGSRIDSGIGRAA